MSERLLTVKGIAKILITLCLITFLSESILIFYLIFESTIIPTIMLVFKYGSQVEKFKATYYIVGYVILLSLPFIFYILTSEDFVSSHYEKSLIFCFLGLMLVKFPIYGLHLWLPNAHVEACTTGRMLLAGILLKLGVYGLITFGGLLKRVSIYSLLIFSVLGIVVGRYIASSSPDTKILAAYSSVTHMNVILFALLVYSPYTSSVGLIISLGHGFASILMFYVVGELYYYNGSRTIYYNLRVGYISLYLMAIICINWLVNVGTPPSLPFFGELIFISTTINYYTLLIAILFVYFMVSFYYSIYIIMLIMKSKKSVTLNITILPRVLIINIMSFNIFILSL